MVAELAADMLDLAGIVRRGDSIMWGQGAAEPMTLTEALVRQRKEVGPVKIFIGLTLSETLQPAHADFLALASYAGIGANQRLARAGVLEFVPCHYSQLPELIARGELACDVVFIQLSRENGAGAFSLGAGNDYLLDAARRARVVVAEINDQAPWTCGSEGLAELRIDYLVRTSRPLPQMPRNAIGDSERRIAAHAAEFIADGAVLETGVGAIPDAILSSLGDRRDLGIHSGMIGDSTVDLIECGAVTNARKRIDRGKTVAGLLLGSDRLYRFAHENPGMQLRPASYTHNARVMAALDNFTAINSAIEVDLTGQVNAELVGGAYVGAVGGQGDFVRAAMHSHGGRSIIALPATAKGGALSRIVSSLSGGITTTPRSDADVIVTEWGSAELRGQSLNERKRRLIAIADPSFRDQLDKDARRNT